MTAPSVFEEELALLRDRCLERRLKSLEPAGPVRAHWQGREVLLFCSNDYLGLTQHPRVLQTARQALKRGGTGAGAARLISGTSAAHTALEEKLARLKKKERALVFSAGYLANLGVLSALAGKGDLILMDKLCHASLIDGARLSGAELRIFPHRQYEKCAAVLSQSSAAKKILVSDTVFSMDGDLADMRALVRLKETYGCLLVADDAHGTGVLGLSGGGALEDEGLEAGVDVITGTLSKALGGLGGFAAASAPLIDYLVNKSRPFIFATALPPLLCETALEALAVLEEEPEIRRGLWRNIQRMGEGLARSGWAVSGFSAPIFPLEIGPEGDALALAELLLQQGFFVPAIRYPSVAKGKARLRITVSAVHTAEEIESFLAALSEQKKLIDMPGGANR